jgi:hypothetical protein
MQDFIAALLAILGTVLVLAGATVTVVKTVPAPASEPEVPGRSRRIVGWISRVNGADRLVAWGVLLLVLAAIASGAISFNFGASAGTR